MQLGCGCQTLSSCCPLSLSRLLLVFFLSSRCPPLVLFFSSSCPLLSSSCPLLDLCLFSSCSRLPAGLQTLSSSLVTPVSPMSACCLRCPLLVHLLSSSCPSSSLGRLLARLQSLLYSYLQSYSSRRRLVFLLSSLPLLFLLSTLPLLFALPSCCPVLLLALSGHSLSFFCPLGVFVLFSFPHAFVFCCPPHVLLFLLSCCCRAVYVAFRGLWGANNNNSCQLSCLGPTLVYFYLTNCLARLAHRLCHRSHPRFSLTPPSHFVTIPPTCPLTLHSLQASASHLHTPSSVSSPGAANGNYILSFI